MFGIAAAGAPVLPALVEGNDAVTAMAECVLSVFSLRFCFFLSFGTLVFPMAVVGQYRRKRPTVERKTNLNPTDHKIIKTNCGALLSLVVVGLLYYFDNEPAYGLPTPVLPVTAAGPLFRMELLHRLQHTQL